MVAQGFCAAYIKNKINLKIYLQFCFTVSTLCSSAALLLPKNQSGDTEVQDFINRFDIRQVFYGGSLYDGVGSRYFVIDDNYGEFSLVEPLRLVDESRSLI